MCKLLKASQVLNNICDMLSTDWIMLHIQVDRENFWADPN